MKTKIIVIEDADSPRTMRIMRNMYTNMNYMFDTKEEAIDQVIFLDPIQPVRFLEVDAE